MLDTIYKKVDKQKRIEETVQRDENVHKEFLKKEEETEKHLTLKTKNEIEQTTLKKSQPVEKELHVEYSKAKRKVLKRCFIRIIGK